MNLIHYFFPEVFPVGLANHHWARVLIASSSFLRRSKSRDGRTTKERSLKYSGSKIGYDQYLLLRTLWITFDKDERLPGEITELLPKAVEMLGNYSSWKTYCSSFDKSKSPEGTFALARHYQKIVEHSKGITTPTSFDTPIAHRTRMRLKEKLLKGISKLKLLNDPETPSKNAPKSPHTPILSSSSSDEYVTDDDSGIDDDDDDDDKRRIAPSPSTPAAKVPEDLRKLMFPPTRDEQIVNTALVIFLNALTIHFDISRTCNWTMHRKGFTAKFKKASFEARTDGYLDDGQENAYALVEVKPVVRQEKLSLIQMQESAQMVAWLMNDTVGNNSGKLRIHVSQDRHEIFMTFAEYDDDYLAYLRNEKAKPSSFLTMRQYGLWNTQISGDMASLGPILLAISLYADAEIRKSTGT